jgi:hypothetical protein
LEGQRNTSPTSDVAAKPSSNFEQQLLQDRMLEIIEADGDVPESREHGTSPGHRSRTCGRTSLAKISSDRMISACGNEPKSTSIPSWVTPTSRRTRMPGAEPDALGARRQVGQERIIGREQAPVAHEMVLDHPDVVDPDALREFDGSMILR